LVKIAINELKINRFSLDPKIGAVKSKLIKKQWISNFFYKKRGNILLKFCKKKEIIGFVLFICNNNKLIVDLIATKGNYKKRGVAQSMIYYLLKKKKFSSFVLQAGKVKKNLNSNNFYKALGLNKKKN